MTQLYMLRPDAPFFASRLPPHPKDGRYLYGPNGKRLSSGFTRHSYGNIFGYISYQLIMNDLGRVLDKASWLQLIMKYVRQAPTYGSKGGDDYAPVQAQRVFDALKLEDIMIEV